MLSVNAKGKAGFEPFLDDARQSGKIDDTQHDCLMSALAILRPLSSAYSVANSLPPTNWLTDII
jgi:hypothetical protein